MKRTVICCLTRGYANTFQYSKLIDRNRSLYEKVIKHRPSVDVLLFHEGNINIEHQQHIIKNSYNMDIKFVQVPFSGPQIEIPQESINTFLDGSCYPGYHLMCQFHFCHIWSFVDEYDIVIRLDEDCILLSDNWIENIDAFEKSSDVFRTIDYNYSNGLDNHPLTNETLSEFLISTFGNDKMYKAVPGTNLYFTKMDFWRRKDVKDVIKLIEDSHGCLKYRWGRSRFIRRCAQSFCR